MTTDNININPDAVAEEALLAAPVSPEAPVSPVEAPLENPEPKVPEEENGGADDDSEGSESDNGLFAEFLDRRQSLIDAGIDMEALDGKFANRELADADYQLLGEQLGYKPEDVKAFIGTKYQVLDLQEKAESYDKLEREKAVAVLDEAAGESYLELFQFVADKAVPAQKKAWDNLLGNEDPEVQLLAIQQMATFKVAHLEESRKQLNENPKPTEIKGANLSLLTQANSTAAQTLAVLEDTAAQEPEALPEVNEAMAKQVAALSWQDLNAICVGITRVDQEALEAAHAELARRQGMSAQ